MTGIVFNACYGGFSLSREAVLLGRKISGDPKWGGAVLAGDVAESGWEVDRDYGHVDVARHDPVLVEVVKKLGDKASGDCARLEIAEARSGDCYRIDEYDGYESVVFNYEQSWKVVP